MRRFLNEQGLYAGVWLVFLVIPVMLIALFSTAGLAWDIAAYLALAAFAVVYIGTFYWKFRQHDQQTLLAGRTPKLTTTLLGTLLLLICTAVTVPSLGGGVANFVPFFIALWMWTLPLQFAVLVGIGWWGIGLVLVWLLTDSIPPGYWLSALIALVIITFFRFLGEHSVRQETLATELAVAHEREEISRDVHDLLGHSLTVIALKIQVARRMLREDPARAEAELDELLAVTQSSLAEVRGVVGKMRTPDLATQLYESRSALETAGISVDVTGQLAHVTSSKRALYAWVLREATTNILRHAQARNVTILIQANCVRITDDGKGIDTAEGHGLTGLRRRVEMAGARLLVRNRHHAGGQSGTELIVEYQA